MTSTRFNTKKIVYLAILTALVIVLQLLGSFIKFGPFSVSLVLVPIAIGGALCGPVGGLWLGLVFGTVVLLSGDAAAFLEVNPFGTIVTVILKGALCGTVAGLVYDGLKKVNTIFASGLAAFLCPVVNTGVFIIGCLIFFYDTLTLWAGGQNTIIYIFTGLIGLNFFFELAVSIILAPVIVRIITLISGEQPVKTKKEKD